MPEADPEFDQLLETLKRAAHALREAEVPFALAGGIASWARGGPPREHDLDFFLTQPDAERALAVLADAGFRTENVCEEDMEVGNGHSHCMSMLLGSAGESIPVRDGVLALGQWQRVLFLELDRERDRRWLVQVVGS
jgi:hypothetical protein